MLNSCEKSRFNGINMQQRARQYFKIGQSYRLKIDEYFNRDRNGHSVKHVNIKRCKMVGATDRFGIFETPYKVTITFRWFELGQMMNKEDLR